MSDNTLSNNMFYKQTMTCIPDWTKLCEYQKEILITKLGEKLHLKKKSTKTHNQ